MNFGVSITSKGGPEALGEARPMEAAAVDEASLQGRQNKSSSLYLFIYLFLMEKIGSKCCLFLV